MELDPRLNDPERAGIRKRDMPTPSIDDMQLVGRWREAVGLPRVSALNGAN